MSADYAMDQKDTHRPDTGESAAGRWLQGARAGDATAFEHLVAPHRRLLHTHCYRMLGSPFDADDALQETLLAAWLGLASFEGRSALGTWLYCIATRICLRLISKRPRRMTSPDCGTPLQSTDELGKPVLGPVWLEPIPDGELPNEFGAAEDPAVMLLRREQIGLAFIAMLQNLPGTQRAVLLLREVLGYSASETAEMLDTTVSSVNSALQRSRRTIGAKMPATVEAAETLRTDQQGLDRLLQNFVTAWESGDVTAMVGLLTKDVRFTMPPLPAWFEGRHFVRKFFAERVFQTPWKLQPLRGNGQPGFACYLQSEDDWRYRPGGVVLLSLRDGRIAAIDSFLDPAVRDRFGMTHDLF
jgi:RNA polymerase sigma-70 factor (TIGR02960 family)